MKIFIRLTFLILLMMCKAMAQQRPHYTQYIFNNYLLNPALSGIENYTDLKFGYRKQWAGIKDSPQTTFFTANWKLGDDYLWKNALSLPDEGDHPMSRNYMQNYTASPPHHGMGVVAVLDELGPISRLDASLTYAYHLQIHDTWNLSVGAAAGVTRIGLDANALRFEEQDIADPALGNTIVSQLKPDLSVGIWLYGSRFFAGASVQQIFSQKLSFTDDINYRGGKEVAHLFVTAGYRLFVDDEISITPSVMFKKVSPTPLAMDMNLKVSFKDKLWVGGSFRKNDSFSGMAGVNINKMFNMTYAYDFTTSELSTVSNGSHEIVLGVQLNNVYEVLSTMRMW